MVSLFKEKEEYQEFILRYLEKENGYRVRDSKEFDRLFAVDREILFEFLDTTQPETMEALRKIYKEDTEETIVNYINRELTKSRGFIGDTLKNGFEISNRKIELMFTKPATDFNKKAIKQYEGNIFSVMEEVWASEKERVDLVIFLNGLPIISIELKSNYSGQDYSHAIYQYRMDRNPKTRLFLWKAGCIVNFAMDTQEVYMTTKLDNEKTFFLPFNMGRGEGVNAGAGNPLYEDKLSVHYMWEDILTKNTLLELIDRFIYLEVKEEENNVTGKKEIRETVIFPRYHQLDLIRKLISDIKENKTALNYLIEHSAGSGKTNSIAWLAHRLVTLHDENNQVIYDNIVIVTDRIVVDRQLQEAILQINHKDGVVRVMDDRCTSSDLAETLKGNTKITATTIQKFPYVVDQLKNLKEKNFAVIIDEAHSSTAGRNMQAITRSLGSGDETYEDADDMITAEIKKIGKQSNISMFAFTATPKPTTLRMFGKLNKYGQYEAFHLYSMKQAIEEGFIIDVLANYTTYKTMYRINKAMEDDPEIETIEAKRKIARFVELHDTNISQRIEVIIEHFRQNVMTELGGQAKAMVVTSSREGAVKYAKAFEEYINKKGYDNIHALVAFSGKVELEDDNRVYTEVGMNKMSEENVPKAFDTDNYNVMIVANKYQTGFDQKKLSAMYIMKSLKGVNAVQTLSRLNRVCPPYDKKVFVLDFSNDYADIKNAFAPFYTTTLLANDLTPNHIYDLMVAIDAYGFIDPMDIDRVNDLIFKKRNKSITTKEQNALIFCLNKSEREIKRYSQDEQIEIQSKMKNFKRFYEYLIQVSCIEDVELHKKYIFISYLLDSINLSYEGGGFDLKGKIKATHFRQVEEETYKKEKMPSKPVMKLPVAAGFNLTEDKKQRLSEIIADINSRTGKNYDIDVATNAAYQIRDIMMKSDELKTSAKNNTENDFRFSYYANVDDALIEGLEQNEDFFTLLLNNSEIKDAILGVL